MNKILSIAFLIVLVSSQYLFAQTGEEIISLNGYWKFSAVAGEGSNYLDESPQETDIIVDNKQTNFVETKGKWSLKEEGAKGSTCWDKSYLTRTFKNVNEEAYVRFKGDAVPESGYYEHFVYYPWANHNAGVVNIKHAEGEFSTFFNMKSRTSVWHSLGVFRIEKGQNHYIEFTSPTKGGISADVVLFRPVSKEEYLRRQELKKNICKADFNDDDWYSLKVPGHWGMINEFSNYSGRGWYRKEIQLQDDWKKDDNKRIRLRFEGVYHLAKVYLNGQLIGEHQGGFTPFEFDVTDKLNYGSKNILSVEADNSYTVGATWNWGGIIRDVNLIRNEDSRISYQYIHAEPNLKKKNANYQIKVRVENNSLQNKEFDVTCSIHKDNVIDKISAKIKVNCNSSKEIELNGKLKVKDVKLWHFDRPELYTLETKISENNKTIHTKSNRFGIRKVEATQTQLLLNGEAVRLVGFNRVSDHRYWGSSEPIKLLELDVDLMKTAGANFTRIMHGTQNEKLLDLCDEKGIMIFEEANIRDLRNPQFVAPEFSVPKQWIKDMIERDVNHACIVGWSTGNELKDHYDYVKQSVEYAKKLDPHRMALHVSNQGYRKGESSANNPLEYGDMIFQNIYQKDPGAVMDTLHSRWPNKAMFFSEFGWSDLSRFSNTSLDNDFQELNKWYGYLRNQRPYTVGASIWTFNDYRSGYTETLPSENRAWGMVNAWRKKRRLFYTHQRENSPVTNFIISEVNELEKTAYVSFHVREKDDFPCYTMLDYQLRLSVNDKHGNTLEVQELDMPEMKPGFGEWKTKINWTSEEGLKLQAELISTNGYTRAEESYYFQNPSTPIINEIKSSNSSVRIHFAKNFDAFEYYAKYNISGATYKSSKTIEDYLDISDLKENEIVEIQLIACNARGESSPSKIKTIKVKGASLAPVVLDGFIADNKLVVGFDGKEGDKNYTIRYQSSKNSAYKQETSTAHGMITVSLEGEKEVFFQIKKQNQDGDSQWSNSIKANSESLF